MSHGVDVLAIQLAFLGLYLHTWRPIPLVTALLLDDVFSTKAKAFEAESVFWRHPLFESL